MRFTGLNNYLRRVPVRARTHLPSLVRKYARLAILFQDGTAKRGILCVRRYFHSCGFRERTSRSYVEIRIARKRIKYMYVRILAGR